MIHASPMRRTAPVNRQRSQASIRWNIPGYMIPCRATLGTNCTLSQRMKLNHWNGLSQMFQNDFPKASLQVFRVTADLELKLPKDKERIASRNFTVGG